MTGEESNRDLVVNRDWLRPWVRSSPDDRTAPAVRPTTGLVRDHGLRPPGTVPRLGEHRRPRPEPRLAGSPRASHQKLELRRTAGPRRPGAPAAGPRPAGRAAGRRRGERCSCWPIDRDASEYAEIPPNTWTLAFGWFMHAIFDMRYGFPFHPNLLPIFVSFHCSKRDLLTDDGHRLPAPVRADRLPRLDDRRRPALRRRAGVLLRMPHHHGQHRLPGHAERARTRRQGGLRRRARPRRVPTVRRRYRHSDDAHPVPQLRREHVRRVELLETYRRRHSGLVTSRLHCYLPVRSLGVPVDFQPKNRSDPRFAGLIDITDAEFDRIRDTISEKLRTVLTAAMSGTPPEAVYELWRELNAADVEAARRRHEAPAEMSGPKADLLAEVDHLRSTQPTTSVED